MTLDNALAHFVRALILRRAREYVEYFVQEKGVGVVTGTGALERGEKRGDHEARKKRMVDKESCSGEK